MSGSRSSKGPVANLVLTTKTPRDITASKPVRLASLVVRVMHDDPSEAAPCAGHYTGFSVGCVNIDDDDPDAIARH
jgi:hypothetical protein